MPALLGRQRELEALEGLIEDVRSGRGWALVLSTMRLLSTNGETSEV